MVVLVLSIFGLLAVIVGAMLYCLFIGKFLWCGVLGILLWTAASQRQRWPIGQSPV
jgi:hypothetical protein